MGWIDAVRNEGLPDRGARETTLCFIKDDKINLNSFM